MPFYVFVIPTTRDFYIYFKRQPNSNCFLHTRTIVFMRESKLLTAIKATIVDPSRTWPIVWKLHGLPKDWF
jgi:hypothetical protein